MALRLWLPLNGSLVNQGLSDVAVTNNGATVNNSGKIGKCYEFGTATNSLSVTSDFIKDISGGCSFAFWVKFIDYGVNYQTIFDINDGGVSWNEEIFAFQKNGNTKRLVFTMAGTNGHTTNNCVTQSDFELNKWYHFVCEYSPGQMIIYKDGEHEYTYNTTVVPKVSAVKNFVIGAATTTGTYQSKSLINDFRVYDHALSLKEIKELSKGLVLHYPLSRVGGDNLLSHYVSAGANNPSSTATGGRTQYYGDYGIIISAIENADTYFSLFLAEQLTQNKTYTISCNASGLLSGTFYNFPLFAQNNGAMGYLKIDHNGLCSLTFTMTYSTQAEFSVDGRTVYRCLMDDGSRNLAFGQSAITLTNFKIEEGDKATPWIPNKNETAYIKAGFNNNIEYDVSGYGNNGTIIGALTYSSDTPRYMVSTYFNGGDNAITVPFNSAISDATIPFTINLWFKKTEIGVDGYESLFGGPAGFEMDTRSGSATSLSLYMASTRGGAVYSPFNLNEWYMVTMTSDRTNEYYYINGELVKTITAKSMPVGSYFIGAWSAYNRQNYKGLISDFRIYSTCLSPTDILVLYHTPTSIANNGTLLTQGEISEV